MDPINNPLEFDEEPDEEWKCGNCGHNEYDIEMENKDIEVRVCLSCGMTLPKAKPRD